MLLTVVTQWVMQFVIIYSVPYMMDSIKFGTFYFFGGCLFVSTIVVYCFVPETKAFPLEKAHLIFQSTIWAPKARKNAERLLVEERAAEAADAKNANNAKDDASNVNVASIHHNEVA